MTAFKVSREQLLETLTAALEPQAYALAMWEGGAAGFDRVDQWSDADVMVVVRDGYVEQAFEATEAALAALSETSFRFRLPEPTWHGHSQCFYSFKDASPYLMLDIVFIQESSTADRFMQAKTHGNPRVCFDKAGVVVEEPLDIEAMMTKMQSDLEMDRMKLDLFWILTAKEIHRGNGIEALSFYTNYVLRPLLAALRITHCPQRHFYTTRYIQYDLPEAAAERLERLFFVRDLEDLQVKYEQARAWYYEVADAVEWEAVRGKLEAA